ncbi:MAG: PA14 domain-containing protein [Puia sp.]|nr:PA14 domain-containing protein [Puia sp.]
MKTIIKIHNRPLKALLSLAAALLLITGEIDAQCTPQGNQTSYGTGNVWIGYVYQGKNFNTYKGYVNEGAAASPNFNESFGGNQVNYNTNGCPAYTDTFSVRYKLTETLASGTYVITVGGDDGYRLSLDGGSTWTINKWQDQGYGTTTDTLTLSGTYNLVLEYYEDFGANQVSFNQTMICMATGDQTVYGTNNTWIGYIYQGMNFNTFKGTVTEGSSSNPTFDENFGNTSNSAINYNTSVCSIQTQQFSARYRLQKTLAAANYVFTVGGDDGFRFSIDGGNTWVINKWQDQSYVVSSYTATLAAGTYNMVLEYYQNGGADRVSFTYSSSILPITLISWSAKAVSASQTDLQWKCTDAVNFDHFNVQRSSDGSSFSNIATIAGDTANNNTANNQDAWSYTDNYAYSGNLYYRLAMVDKNGTTTYSTVLQLNGQNSSSSRISIYPTLVEGGTVFVESTQPVNQARWELFDLSGRKVGEQQWAVLSGRQQVSMSGSGGGHLIAGSYIARLTAGNSILARQILVVR